MLKPKTISDQNDSKACVFKRTNSWIVMGVIVRAKALFSSIRKLAICSALAFSLTITGFSSVLIFGLSTPSQAEGKGDCVIDCDKIGGKAGNGPASKGKLTAVGIAGSNDHVYYWYSDGTVSSGTTNNPAKYRNFYRSNQP